MGLFARLHLEGNTIITVTHESDIAMYANRVIPIRNGRIEREIVTSSDTLDDI
jgi:putative ABC transport system ATP-binding protein